MRLTVHRLDPHAYLPTKAYPDDVGWDLYLLADAALAPGETAKLRTGVAVAPPEGYWTEIKPRSGIPGELLIHNGTIDPGYRGELLIKARNLGDAPLTLAAGTRVAQLIAHRLVDLPLAEVDALPVASRGASGFGSSGR
jgi:dUTP pyrophosphatase